MIPMLLKIKIPRKDKQDVSIYLPLFVAWLLLLPVLLLLLPFLVLAAILLWMTGYGRLILVLVPLLFALIWNLQGLTIDIDDKDNKIYLSFI